MGDDHVIAYDQQVIDEPHRINPCLNWVRSGREEYAGGEREYSGRGRSEGKAEGHMPESVHDPPGRRDADAHNATDRPQYVHCVLRTSQPPSSHSENAHQFER